MDFNLIHIGIVIIAAVALLIIFWPRDNALHRNLKSGFVKIVVVVLVVVVIICCFLIGDNIIRNGVGELYTDYAEIVTPAGSESEGDIIRITVNVDKISINNKEYSDIDEIKPIVSEGIANGKKVHIVDDYALSRTYDSLLTTLDELGVKSEDISEETVY